jgi:hypothetical protein
MLRDRDIRNRWIYRFMITGCIILSSKLMTPWLYLQPRQLSWSSDLFSQLLTKDLYMAVFWASHIFQFTFFFFYGIGVCTCKAGTLTLKPYLQSILLWLFWRLGLMNYLPRLSSVTMLPISDPTESSQFTFLKGTGYQWASVFLPQKRLSEPPTL